MKEEIRDRIKILEEKIITYRNGNSTLVQQGQKMQHQITLNNTEILKCQGGIEELKKSIA